MIRSIKSQIIPTNNQIVDISCTNTILVPTRGIHGVTTTKCTKTYVWNVPNDKVYENNCPKNSRTRVNLIKSGQQPNDNEKTYSYSYRDYLKKRSLTYNRKLPTNRNLGPVTEVTGYGGECLRDLGACSSNNTIWNPNNSKFHQQGAVSSSTRLDRLKLETIRKESRCAPGTVSQVTESECNGVYAGNKIRFTGHVQNSPCFPLYRLNKQRQKKNNC